ncbi:MAG: 16S rRNA (uracil(1498)-N(3))-methyltransferase [Sphaerochaeta sp.]|jgi:RsmE family RNA methyltransferase|uniref:RsmE family RNA methyltransferase n=1 Tax=Sphaerochaeta sp. TaxID=1972642 RepID=UPI002FC70C5F
MNIILFEALEAYNTLSLTDERAKHILKVLHLQVGDTFLAGVVNQGKGTAKLVGKDEEQLRFTFSPNDTEIARLYPVTLLVAQVRPISMRRILREAVSLGVERIILCTTETGEKSYAQANLYTSGEYRSILLDGAMQSGECGISEVQFARSVKEAVQSLDQGMLRIVLDNVRIGKPLSTFECKHDAPVVLAIGPERGFTDHERDVFAIHDFQFATLGSRILRTETACSAGLAVLLGRMGLL